MVNKKVGNKKKQMKITNKVYRQRAARVLGAWAQLAPEEKFGGYALADFQTVVAKADGYRQELEQLNYDYIEALRFRDEADLAMGEVTLEVVDGVKGHEKFGANAALYKAMGYVPRDERRSGLTRAGESEGPLAPVVVAAAS